MTERPVFPQDIRTRNSFDAYLQILGKEELPKSVEDMPENLVLPASALGELVDSIIKTGNDGLERAQSVHWDTAGNKYRYSKVFLGNDKNTGDMNAAYLAAFAFFGKKTLLVWHTHPDGIWYFSRQDISSIKGFQRKGYISVVGSEDGIVAIAQTGKSVKTPWSGSSVYDHAMKFLTNGKYLNKDAYGMSKMVDELGLKYYFYFPDGGISAVTKSKKEVRLWSYPV